MKQTENNEMDLLLRSLAKRASSISDTVSGTQGDDAHLDADELNAFAERSMPAAARARYTTHIADCSRCRKLVTALSAAAGLPIAETKTEDRAQTNLWQRLPAFLSPAVLRFAVPALALLVVVTVGVITFRQQPSLDFVAQHQERAAPQSDSKTYPETTTPEGHTRITTESSPPPVRNAAPAAETETQAKAGEKAKAVDETSTVAAPSEYFAKDPPKVEAKKAGEPTFAPEPAAAPAARPQPTTSPEADKNEAVAKQNQTAAGDTATRDARAERQAVEDRGALSRSRKAASSGRGGALSSAAPPSESKQKRADQDAEIREVAGRRFQRQGNSWIDVDYDAGRPALTVVRGSEQYRALVADEPAIRTIAERLGGEVIVVWKGRAYRIR